MDTGTALGIVLLLAALVALGGGAGSGVELIGGLFYVSGMGWPRGVQEDDDFSWSWRPPGARAPDAPVSTEWSGAATRTARVEPRLRWLCDRPAAVTAAGPRRTARGRAHRAADRDAPPGVRVDAGYSPRSTRDVS